MILGHSGLGVGPRTCLWWEEGHGSGRGCGFVAVVDGSEDSGRCFHVSVMGLLWVGPLWAELVPCQEQDMMVLFYAQIKLKDSKEKDDDGGGELIAWCYSDRGFWGSVAGSELELTGSYIYIIYILYIYIYMYRWSAGKCWFVGPLGCIVLGW